MESKALNELLSLLRHNGVLKFEQENIKIEFSERAYLSEPIIHNSDGEPSKKPEGNQAESEEDLLFYSSKA